MARLSLTKCQADGNDFVVLEAVDLADPGLSGLAARLCDRRFGVGADGLLAIRRSGSPDADVDLRIVNADGSDAEMCGNGVRCIARYWLERVDPGAKRLALHTPAGIVRTAVLAPGPHFRCRVAMGVPAAVHPWEHQVTVDGAAVDGADVDVGNPHSVAFVAADPASIDLTAAAGAIASARPHRGGVNVELARVADGGAVVRVRERGVGETLACGTGACAVGVAAMSTGRATSPLRVRMPGGEAVIEWAGPGSEVVLTGGAELVFDAVVEFAEMPGALEAPASPARA